jgi:demethylmenaquinone methyltransferase/2-methoxy-6-polyprenyl-1,4-benzoquinol methylase
MAQEGKKEQVRNMFNNIAGKYDFLNHFLSLGIDHLWRRSLVKMMKKQIPTQVLDIATGTGDLAVAVAKAFPNAKVIGADISENMLEIGKQKMIRKKLNDRVLMEMGDSENLKYEDGYFDAVTVAFGVRNYEDLQKGLNEMYRVTQIGGRVYILEFSKPSAFPFKQIYNFYFLKVLPLFGKTVSKDHHAYTYLPESVQQFPDGHDFLNYLEDSGYQDVSQKRLTFGIASIYSGKKAE